ncbi:hypothetical protein C8R43DRAFT_1241219 [Mycena crocata]|nr:hypothetical protein C8R43DRAFT_1241219 [Mycena crocata]
MVNTFTFFVAALFAGSVAALPIGSDSGLVARFQFGNPAAQQAAHDAQASSQAIAAAAAAASESAAGIDIAASIAAASSSAAAAAATHVVNPLDPVPDPTANSNLTPEQLGQLSGLRAKLAIDNQFGDQGAAIKDQEDISAILEDAEGSFGGFGRK